MGRLGQGQDHQPGGVHVQTVHGRLGDTLRQEVPQPGDHRISPGRAPTGNRQETAGFIDHYQRWIAMEEGKSRAGHDRPQSTKPRIGRHFCVQAG